MSEWILQMKMLWASKTKLMTILLISVCGLVFLYQSSFYVGEQILDGSQVNFRENYLNGSIPYVKMVLTLFSVFLFTSGYLGNSNKYLVFWIDGKHSRMDYNFYRQVVYLLVFVLFLAHVLLLFHLIIRLVTPFDYALSETFPIFIKLGIQAVFYGIVSVLFVKLIPHSFAMIIPIIFFWTSEIFSSSEENMRSQFIREVFSIIPTLILTDGKYQFFADTGQYVIIFFSLYLLVYLISVNEETR